SLTAAHRFAARFCGAADDTRSFAHMPAADVCYNSMIIKEIVAMIERAGHCVGGLPRPNPAHASALWRGGGEPALICHVGIGWGGRIRTSEWRDQNPLPYHLATPQQNAHLK